MLITAGRFRFRARYEEEGAPASVAAVRRLLPLRGTLIQARWSGESAWVPLGELDVGCGVENATKPYLARNRKFESVSLQRRVRRERSPAPC